MVVAKDAEPHVDPDLTPALAEQYARLALAGLVREYPNQPGYRLACDADLRPPREVHPAFHGCYDWHSAVHGHWLLIRLLRIGLLEGPTADEAAALLRRHLTPEYVGVERNYYDLPGRASFEWPYGWAWLLALEAEARQWDPAVAQAVCPLADLLANRVPEFLSRMSHPQRSGQHGDTAFALSLMRSVAVRTGRDVLTGAIDDHAERFYLGDEDYPWQYERGPYDFHSPGLSEIDLMSQVLGDRFVVWLERFWQGFSSGTLPEALAKPAACVDPSDGKLAHLTGLNLERARVLNSIAERFEVPALRAAADAHRQAGLAGVRTGHYAGEHWLATFAVRLLTQNPRLAPGMADARGREIG